MDSSRWSQANLPKSTEYNRTSSNEVRGPIPHSNLSKSTCGNLSCLLSSLPQLLAFPHSPGFHWIVSSHCSTSLLSFNASAKFLLSSCLTLSLRSDSLWPIWYHNRCLWQRRTLENGQTLKSWIYSWSVVFGRVKRGRISEYFLINIFRAGAYDLIYFSQQCHGLDIITMFFMWGQQVSETSNSCLRLYSTLSWEWRNHDLKSDPLLLVPMP